MRVQALQKSRKWVGGGIACAVILAMFAATASAQVELSMTRDVISGLDEDGWLVPGTTSMEFQLTVSITSGDAGDLTALGIAEELPTGWIFESYTASSSPAAGPSQGDEGDLAWAWATIPALPMTLNYIVTIPDTETGPVDLIGRAKYRTGGGEISTDDATTTIQTEPTSLTVTRELSGDALAGEGGHYLPGNDLSITITIEKSGSDTVTALGFSDTLPTGWVYKAFVESDPPVAPAAGPSAGDEGDLAWAWATVPSFPYVFTYEVTIPASAGGEACLDGIAKFRTGGAEIPSNQVLVCLDEFPCLSYERVVTDPSGGCYSAGNNITLAVNFTSQCTSAFTALGLSETAPDGWTFVDYSLSEGASAPAAGPSVGDTGTLEFAWATIPNFPFTLFYTLSVPAEEDVDFADFNGVGKYRLSGAEILTLPVETEVCGADIIPPVITLNGDAAVTVECGDSYTDAGATALDETDGDITDQIVVGGDTVDTATPGDYTITYDVSDSSDNAADQVVRVVTVADTTPPVLTLVGDPTMTIECGIVGVMIPGATATDVCDGDLDVTVGGDEVDLSTPGVYTITYDASDAAGNAGTQLTREVTVADTTAPVISLIGDAAVTVECSTSYTDAGATALDGCEGDLSVMVGGDTVDPNTVGVYTITYNVSDTAGNAATEVTRTVTVSDTAAPTITLTGGDVTVPVTGGSYTEPGFSAADDCDGDLTDDVTTSVAPDGLDSGLAGSYVITYRVADAAGNADTATRNVTVLDTEAPVITLNGDNPMTMECGDNYFEAGATVTDNVDDDLVATSDATEVLDRFTPGTYTITYSAVDTAGNEAVDVTRTVVVEDTTVPVLTLVGDSEVTVECAASYTEQGATAADDCDGDLSDSVVVGGDTVDTATVGVYTVSYDVSDGAGNAAVSLSRTVTVEDSVDPVITIVGENPVTVECGATYTDAGATAADDCDGDLSASIVTDDTAVNTAVTGDYQVVYTVSDATMNETQVTRTVTVADTTAPVISLIGDATVEVDCDGSYFEQGAGADDACDGDLTSAIVIGGDTVDPTTPGAYTVTYDVSDASMNAAAQVTRTVTVLNNCAGQPCDLSSVSLLTPATDYVVQSGSLRNVPFTAAVVVDDSDETCVQGTIEVTYTVNDAVIGTSVDADSAYYVSADLGADVYNVVVTAEVLESGMQVEDTGSFTIAVGVDANEDGLLDNPFGGLPNEGDQWDAIVASDNCERGVTMLTVIGEDGAAGSVDVVLFNPEDENQVIVATIPRGLVLAGEQAVISLAGACDLDSLLGADEAAVLEDEPAGFIAGGIPFELSILISSDGGQSFAEIDNARIAALPISLSINGLAFGDAAAATFASHTTGVVADATFGVLFKGEEGTWSSDAIQNVVADGTTLTAELTSLSTFEAIEVVEDDPVLSVDPGTAEYIFGIAETGKSVDATFTVTNTGGGTLTGMATLADDLDGVFSIVGDANYTLTEGQSATVTVRFAPDATKDFTGTLTFDGNDNDVIAITVRGTGTVFNKQFTFFGCAPGVSASGSFLGDFAIVAFFLSMLMVAGRMRRRGEQS